MRIRIAPSFTRSILLLWLCHLVLDFFTGIWPIYKTIAQIDIAVAGLIIGVCGFIGELLQLCFGYWADRGHRKKILMIGVALSSAVIGITFTEGIGVFFLLLLLLMMGSGAFHPAAAGFATSLSANYKSSAMLFFASGGAIGLGISQLAFTKIISLCNGHALILFVPVLIILLLVACYPFKQETVRPSISLSEFIQPILKARKPLALLYFAQVANLTLFNALIFLLPDLMQAKESHHWLCMGGGHLCVILGSAVMMTPAGYLCDKYGHKPILLMVMLSSTLLLYAFLSQSGLPLWGTILFLSCLGGMIGSVNPILVSWANRLVPEHPSTVSALLMGLAWCFANFGATWAGLIAKTLGENPIIPTLSWLALLSCLAFCLILAVPKPLPQPSIDPL